MALHRKILLALLPALEACSGGQATHETTSIPSTDASTVGPGPDAAVADGGAPGVPCTNPASCLARFTIPGSAYQLPYYSSFPLTQPNALVTDIVVFNEGLDRDAATDFTTMISTAEAASALDHTLVITPHFEALVNTDGSACPGNPDTPLANDLVWTCNAWSDGLASTSDPQVTSYGALDALLASALAAFPTVARVTVAGFSAGGQLTQRYVAANQVDPQGRRHAVSIRRRRPLLVPLLRRATPRERLRLHARRVP